VNVSQVALASPGCSEGPRGSGFPGEPQVSSLRGRQRGAAQFEGKTEPLRPAAGMRFGLRAQQRAHGIAVWRERSARQERRSAAGRPLSTEGVDSLAPRALPPHILWISCTSFGASTPASAKATSPRRIRTRVDSPRSTPGEQDIEGSPGGYDSDHTELNIVQRHPPWVLASVPDVRPVSGPMSGRARAPEGAGSHR
jgi:hypothetical protein